MCIRDSFSDDPAQIHFAFVVGAHGFFIRWRMLLAIRATRSLVIVHDFL